jgi:beta-glucosidase
MSKKVSTQFDSDFLWGAAVAAYQIDGANNTQWAAWERANARHLARQSQKHFGHVPGYEQFAREAADPDNYICGVGIKHRQFYKTDLALLKNLNLNAFRTTIEWARVEPHPGRFDKNEIKFLKKYFAEMRQNGLEPIVSLWHWTMPTWFTNMGGFTKRQNIKYFTRFCQFVLREFKDDIKWILTLNEPMLYVAYSYLVDDWPPAKIAPLTAWRAARNLARAHNQIYKIAKKISPHFQVSIAHNSAYIHDGDQKILSKMWVKLMRYARDGFFLNRVCKKLDFLGLNWYTSDTYFGVKMRNPNNPVSDLGWDMRPSHIQFSLEHLYKRYKLPILITENGCADSADTRRQWWIDETIKSMQCARHNGVKLLGYLHWSAFDNFEWDKGFWPRFGLIAVDRKTLKRTTRQSAKWYGEQVKKFRKM